MLSKKYQQYLLAFGVVFVLAFLQFLGLLRLTTFINAANLWKEQNFILLMRLSRPFARITDMWKLTAKLEDLQYRYSEAATALIEVNALKKENQELRKILENSDRSYQQSIITAPVISFAQSFVAAGSQSGIRSGSAVLYKGTLLGLIDQVQEKQSSVLLLRQLSNTGLLVETSDGVKGLLKGNGREVLLTEVASDANLEIGQLVMTSSQVGLQKGLLIGRIVKILTDNQALATKTALVEQLVSFYETSIVEIF